MLSETDTLEWWHYSSPHQFSLYPLISYAISKLMTASKLPQSSIRFRGLNWITT